MSQPANYLKKFLKVIKTLSDKIWFFPAVLFLIVLTLGLLQINGSSIGIYHELLYGKDSKDSSLLFNEPRSVRSDEWLVTTQLSLAQIETGFEPVNQNVGNGIDISVLVDAPTKDLGQFFKPHNFAFFVLPAEVAFSLKWWLLSYFLIVSVYFFVLAILPKRKLIAVLLSLSFLASPFIAWWYQYITLAPIYYTLFGIVVAIKMMQASTVKKSILWGILLAYIGTSFALVLYPPFQIPAALFALAFLIGFILDNKSKLRSHEKSILAGTAVAVASAGIMIALCLIPKLPVIEIVANTAYPGNRLTESGGFNSLLFMSSNTSLLAQSDSRAGAFTWLLNQSEGSNFLLVFIFLIPLLVFFTIKYRRKVPYFWTIITLFILTTIFIAWLFVPNIDILGKLTLLNRVPHERLLLGFGLINLLAVILFVSTYENKQFKLPKLVPILYPILILILYTILNLYISKTFPGFMGERLALLLAIPYALIVYLLLRYKFNLGLALFLIFSVVSVFFIHPVYVGMGVLRDSELSRVIKSVDTNNSQRWVTDSLQLENFTIFNGKQSLSGVYVYPDTQLWQSDFSKSDINKFNRYAHVHFKLDRNANEVIKPSLDQPSPDQLVPKVEPCDIFLQKNNVGYIMTTEAFFKEQAPCAELTKFVSFPRANIYIYKLNF